MQLDLADLAGFIGLGAKRSCGAGQVASLEEKMTRRLSELEEGELCEACRSCDSCGFLSAASSLACEACKEPLMCQRLDEEQEEKEEEAVQEACRARKQIKKVTTSRLERLQLLCVPLDLDARPLSPQVHRIWSKKVAAASRQQLIQALFQGLDSNGAGVLGCWGLYRYARRCGFGAGKKAWREEYGALCEEYGLDPCIGIDVEDFGFLVGNLDFRGYSTDEELRDMLLWDAARLLKAAARLGGDWSLPDEAAAALLALPQECQLHSGGVLILHLLTICVGRRRSGGSGKDTASVPHQVASLGPRG